MALTPVTERPPMTDRRSGSRRMGYLIAIAINGLFLYMAQHLLEWEWFDFLTSEFDDVIDIITASYVVTMVVNALFFLSDPKWFRSLGNAITAGLSFIATARVWQVYPFDFSTYDTNWSWLIRSGLLIALIGSSVSCVVNTVKFLIRRPRAQT